MIAPNTLLQNRYLVQNQIGQGGMGTVYVATDQRFGSTVALKETFFDDAGMRKAFEREARLLNHLRHAALPRVSDHFMEDEGQFLVMEYIPGPDLAEKLKERGGAFPLAEVLNWADQLLDALDYLHTQEPPVIHRDIKPQNLKLTARNHIVLLDFGLAKGTPLQTKVTATGSVFGYSRHYAPLEQIQGTGTDPRSDIYSLAATLYHLMTGQVPPDALTRATAVLNGADDPLRPADQLHVQVPPEVGEVLQRSLALNSGQRPQTAELMREALREAGRHGQVASAGTGLKASPSISVYEQETQIIAPGAKGTAAGALAADKTGAVEASEGATGMDGAPQTGRGGSRTKADPEESVVTKVASAQTPAPKRPARSRAVLAAAIGVLLVGAVALAYYFTRNPQPASTDNANTRSATSTPDANTSNQVAPTPAPTAEVTVAASPTPEAATPRHTPARSTRAETQPTPKEEEMEADDEEAPETPETPGPNTIPNPRRPGRVIVLPPGMTREDAMRIRDEQRKAAAEARREAQERKREEILRAIERERERRRRMGQP